MLSNLIQLVGKSQLGRLGRLRENLICLLLLNWFSSYLDFFST